VIDSTEGEMVSPESRKSVLGDSCITRLRKVETRARPPRAPRSAGVKRYTSLTCKSVTRTVQARGCCRASGAWDVTSSVTRTASASRRVCARMNAIGLKVPSLKMFGS
jgi:hypothetical protein